MFAKGALQLSHTWRVLMIIPEFLTEKNIPIFLLNADEIAKFPEFTLFGKVYDFHFPSFPVVGIVPCIVPWIPQDFPRSEYKGDHKSIQLSTYLS